MMVVSLQSFELIGILAEVFAVCLISWENLGKLRVHNSRFVSSYKLKSGNAIKQIHISQLTNPTQQTFLGQD